MRQQFKLISKKESELTSFIIVLLIVKMYEHYYPKPVEEIVEEADAIDLAFIQADVPKLLNSIKVGSTRVRYIVLSLRNFSRLDESEVKLVDVHEGL